MAERMRLQKYLSRAGVASRREAERLMLQGRVRVNGARAVELGTRVDPEKDRVELDGETIHPAESRWIMLNKTRGSITTRKDPRGRRTVYALLSPRDQALRYVGRLDRDTEGLLLFTNEGNAHHALLHPSSAISRRYRAGVTGIPDRAAIAALERGVVLEDGPARAEDVRVERVRPDGAIVSLVVREGRKREVRRLLEAVGHPVRRLRRVAFGPVNLEGLAPGSWRELRTEEIAALRDAAGIETSEPGPTLR